MKIRQIKESTKKNISSYSRIVYSLVLRHFTPLHYLPGRPTSFQSYLKSVLPNLTNFSVERHNINFLSASTSAYKDVRIRAFVTASFLLIKAASFTGECNGFTLTADVFPQFSQVDKGYFNCEICITFYMWAILTTIYDLS